MSTGGPAVNQDLAFVRWFVASQHGPALCQRTQLQRYTNASTIADRFGIVELASIRRLVHIAPDYRTSTLSQPVFLINDYVETLSHKEVRRDWI